MSEGCAVHGEPSGPASDGDGPTVADQVVALMERDRARARGPEALQLWRAIGEARDRLVAWLTELEEHPPVPLRDAVVDALANLDREIKLAERSHSDERGPTLERLRELLALARGATKGAAISATEAWLRDPDGRELALPPAIDPPIETRRSIRRGDAVSSLARFVGMSESAIDLEALMDAARERRRATGGSGHRRRVALRIVEELIEGRRPRGPDGDSGGP